MTIDQHEADLRRRRNRQAGEQDPGQHRRKRRGLPAHTFATTNAAVVPDAEAKDKMKLGPLGGALRRREGALRPPRLLQVAEQRDELDPQPADRVHDRFVAR